VLDTELVRDNLADGASGAWRPWTVWVPSTLGLVSSALLLVAYGAAGIMSTWDTPMPGRGWLGVGAIGQCGLAGVTVVVLVTGVKRPRWRRTGAATAWMIIPVGAGLFLLTGRLASA
jgi:hypothetical protein